MTKEGTRLSFSLGTIVSNCLPTHPRAEFAKKPSARTVRSPRTSLARLPGLGQLFHRWPCVKRRWRRRAEEIRHLRCRLLRSRHRVVEGHSNRQAMRWPSRRRQGTMKRRRSRRRPKPPQPQRHILLIILILLLNPHATPPPSLSTLPTGISSSSSSSLGTPSSTPSFCLRFLTGAAPSSESSRLRRFDLHPGWR